MLRRIVWDPLGSEMSSLRFLLFFLFFLLIFSRLLGERLLMVVPL